MAKKIQAVAVSKSPNSNCRACSGWGTVHMTAQFKNGVHEFDWPCWECFGQEVRLPLPAVPDTEN